MTDDMNVALFDLPADPVAKAPRSWSCGALGLRGGWVKWTLDARPALYVRTPVCNRKRGHDGPHRYYDRKARICAEW